MLVRLFIIGKPERDNDFFQHSELVALFVKILEEKKKDSSYQWSGIEVSNGLIKSIGLFSENLNMSDEVISLNKQFREMLAKYEFKAISLSGSCTPSGTVSGIFDVDVIGNFTEIEFDETGKVITDLPNLGKV
jgi:hypothetical protein